MERSSHSDSATASEPAGVQRPRLLDELRARVRRLGLSLRTEQAYAGWVRRFILANGKRHPRDMGAREVEAFLTVWRRTIMYRGQQKWGQSRLSGEPVGDTERQLERRL